jgi:hypothetical protein
LTCPDTEVEIETAPTAEPLAKMPLPADAKTVFLGGLFALAMLRQTENIGATGRDGVSRGRWEAPRF